MTKATHKGTCQVCDSVQKLPKNRLSKHGYTVEYGFFNGVCMGAGYDPIEVSCERLKEVVEIVKGSIKLIELQIETLKQLNGTSGFFNEVEVEITEEMVSTRKALLPGNSRAAWLNFYGIHGSTKEQIARSMNEIEVKKLGYKIRKMENYINQKTEQINSWEPKETTPLKAA
jgi:hypothetical protein